MTMSLIASLALSGCSQAGGGIQNGTDKEEAAAEPDISKFLVAVEEEPDTVDFQCTSLHYTVAQNAFNRLVEMENNAHESAVVMPSLAKSWEVSEDGCTYTFHLREGIKFSNGSDLTSQDVGYTFTRLLTHPDSCNQDIVHEVLGADKLMAGETDTLEGFKVIDDLDFSITLEKPFSAFLACLSMPGASILDEETTKEAGDRFGMEPEWTVGTGPYIFWKWIPGEGMMLKANPDCWMGLPKNDGLNLRFIEDAKAVEKLYDEGGLDVMDLDELGSLSEHFMNGDTYKDRLFRVRPVPITYIALNESVRPLDDQRVRKALQLALDRQMLLDAAYSGRGEIENGIFPHGLHGHNDDLPEIPYDPDEAVRLLKEAGFADGFDLTISVKSSAARWERNMMNLVAAMWQKAGVNTTVTVIEESEWMRLRKTGKLACYEATWVADFNDPDNFIYTFFGNKENTAFRSLCYPREDIMERVRNARTITDTKERIEEYRDLEKTIVQDDAAWIPLFSRLRYYVGSERVKGMRASWNGSVKNNYRYMSVSEE
ncbi:MAG: ABC transporter substrate-binding protein, partial [Lachnospiraceae bacterium]|nr:ABC transporter substrate-binding protein [Lachnospiraceae bacterium]